MFLAGSKNVVAYRDELNRINVFPVPDGDTGTNLVLTLRSMAEVVDGIDDASVSRVADALAEAGVLAARGNSGMMLAHFFLGLAEGLDGRRRADARQLTRALRHAVDSLYQAVEQPVEGTLLTVVREAAEAAARTEDAVPDLGDLARVMLSAASESLERTPEMLPTLAEAGVVDAGAQGFVHFLEGAVALVEGRANGERPSLRTGSAPGDAAAAAAYPDDADRAYRYCTEFVIHAEPPPRDTLVAAVTDLGGSLIVTRATTLAKIHIHTDDPAAVRTALAALGAPVEAVKREDMRAQHSRRGPRVERRLALVTDSTCDLPPEIVIRRGITVVPLTVMFGDESYLDQLEIDHSGFGRRLADPRSPPPTTSQPSPAQLQAAYGRAAESSERVLGIFLSGALSGTFAQAEAAATRFRDARIRVFDSRTASFGLGLLVRHAADLADRGMSVDEIIAELEWVRAHAGALVTVENVEHLRRSGRVGAARALLAGLLDLKPILSLDEQGAVVPAERVRGRDALVTRTVDLLHERLANRVQGSLRMAVAHVMCPERAERLRSILEREFEPEAVHVGPAAAVLAAHTGPGAWGVFYQVERS